LKLSNASLARRVDREQKGITGLETAIILIAFVVVASVFSFTVLSTGIFTSERSKETVYAGLEEAQSSLEPRGSMVAYKGLVGSTETVFKVSFTVANAANGEPVDLTPPYTKDDSGTDPDVSAGAEYVTTVSYSDKNQYLSDLPWTVDWPGYDSSDNLLEENEKAEITVWLLNRNTATAIGSSDSVAYMTTEGGITSSGTLLGINDEFTIEVQPPRGPVLVLERSVPAKLQTVMDLH
jgi:flagellin FlaB